MLSIIFFLIQIVVLGLTDDDDDEEDDRSLRPLDRCLGDLGLLDRWPSDIGLDPSETYDDDEDDDDDRERDFRLRAPLRKKVD